MPQQILAIDPRDPTLRRLHEISELKLLEKIRDWPKCDDQVEPVSILGYDLGIPGQSLLKFVIDGNHRVQAAINLGKHAIPYVEASQERIREVMGLYGHDLDAWAQRSARFHLPSFGRQDG